MLARLAFGRTRFALPVLLFLAAPVAGLAQPATANKAAADPLLARVNGHDIKGSQVMALIRRLPEQSREMPMEKLVPVMVDTLINTQLIQEAAANEHLQNDAEVKRRLAAAETDITREVYIERLVAKDMTDAKLHSEYERYVKTVPSREEVDAKHILVKSEGEAKQIIAQLERGADFNKLAKDKSIDPAGKGSGGDLGWFTRDQMVPEFANAAFALKKGQFTKTPVKTRFGWHIIKLVDRRAAPPPSFDEIKRDLAVRIQGEVIGAKVKALRANAKVEVFGTDGKPVPQNATSDAAAPKRKK
jgi:peptidyl-prolyl cis-trans isomerase C